MTLPPARVLAGRKPSPQPVRVYSGPAVPTAYDVNWQHFTNLTKDQIAWFQAQPEWQNFVAWVAIKGPQATAQSDVSLVQMNVDLTAASIPLAVNPTPLPEPPTPSPRTL